MEFGFFEAMPQEWRVMILILVGLLVLAGILALYDKRKNMVGALSGNYILW